MKRITSFMLLCLLILVVAAGCSSKKVTWTLDKKHKPLPDYVMNSSEKIQETYIMASKYPDVLAQVPCYCGCGTQDGHNSNMNCYIDKLGENKAVEQWDSMSIS
ncbi:putative lipoprotein [Neobacillus massiliamazoniensis]|uniref:Putative lipoprotein n=2 Tax=Neobacillus massiliamazoniensis TaxID=1499688 RepID=A0A0U1P1B8_9BACI|nr:putative lipoprotein [Neobacillus massiliamazoniensis]